MGKILVIEMGYKNIKFAFSGKIYVYPTLLYHYFGKTDNMVNYCGMNYVVGEKLQNYSLIPYTSTDFFDKYACVFVYEVLRRLNFPDLSYIIITFPLDLKYKLRRLKQLCTGFNVNFKTFNYDVFVAPAGFGAFLGWGYLPETQTVVLDIGYHIVSVLSIKNSKAFLENSHALFDVGVSTLLHNVAELVFAKTGWRIDEQTALTILQNQGKFKHESVEYNLSAHVEKLKEFYTDRLIYELFSNLEAGQLFKTAEDRMLIGGGAYNVIKYFPTQWKLYLHEPYEYTNLTGFLEYLSRNYK